MEKAEEKSILKENIEKNKQIEASSKTSIGDLIKDEIEESTTKKDEEVDLLENFKKRLSNLSNTDSTTSFELILKAINENLEKGERIEVRVLVRYRLELENLLEVEIPNSGEAIELSERKVPTSEHLRN